MQKQHTIIEHQLQQLWQDKRLPFHLFKLTNGSSVEIIRTGLWNLAGSGPDFQMAEIQYDQLRWFGSVEFHLKSSDWYRHQHHQDQSYDNVILHVVHEHDQEVFIHDKPLPTLELKTYLSGEFGIPKRYDWTKTPQFPCKKHLHAFLPDFQQMQYHAIKQRLQRKFTQVFESSEGNEAIYQLISAAFGTKTNSLSFEILAQQIPLVWHQEKSASELIEIIQSNEQGWKCKNRILQPKMIKRVHAWLRFIQWYFFDNHASLEARHQLLNKGFHKAGLTNVLLQRNIQINAITYIEMWMDQKKSEKSSGLLKGMKYLQQIPSEQHRITRIWEKMGIRAKNALESQANLEIYQQFCENNKCLHCCVGQQLLKP
jgi:hypothetical protein